MTLNGSSSKGCDFRMPTEYFLVHIEEIWNNTLKIILLLESLSIRRSLLCKRCNDPRTCWPRGLKRRNLTIFLFCLSRCPQNLFSLLLWFSLLEVFKARLSSRRVATIIGRRTRRATFRRIIKERKQAKESPTNLVHIPPGKKWEE